MGLEREVLRGSQPDDIINAVFAHVKDGYKFDESCPLTHEDKHYTSDPSLSDQASCLVYVIDANKVQMADDQLSDKRKIIRQRICYKVSTKTCEKNILEGDSCILKLPNEIGQIINANKGEIKWSFTSSSLTFVVQWKNGRNRKTFPDATIESDGSLKLHNVKVSNTGKYTFEAYDNEDKIVANHKKEITVYAKALKPNLTFKCRNGNATLTCETQMKDRRDLTITWFKETELIQSENKANLILTSTQLQKYKQYSCRIQNPVSEAQSDIIQAPCTRGIVRGKNGGFPDNWLMVRAVAVGGVFLLLLFM
ncbi:hypothetical protein E1301_Tti011972 [Triplophysa tibetana]|uniref:Ig-like domain-containing protein n=1 Tax=Triplophysa tibetana TaxID=1572043 RepID=A0A5A9PPA0_9TELE|nr:hypothetical protein E1301_Tti011972 [Triplophysa tibetana]